MSTRLAPSPPAPFSATGQAPTPRRPTARSALAVPNPPEAALLAVSVAAVVGMVRLFSTGDFLAPVLASVVVAHGMALVLRRLGVRTAPAAALSGLGLALVLAWAVEPHTLSLGLPLGHTWSAMSADVHTAASRFGLVRAPTTPIRGFVLVCATAAWVAAFAADTLAFRARLRFEAMAPSFVLFICGAILGGDRFRLPTTALYLAAVLGFVVLGDASERAAPAWFGGRSGDGRRAMVQSGLATASVAVLAALVVGPRIPGAHDIGAMGWRKGTDRGSRVTVSPLVDIRSRLVDQSGTELFSVASPVGTYWRLTALERFDGNIWSSVGSYAPARGRLPGSVPTSSTEQSLVQQFDIAALSAIWLPAAYQPRRLDGAQGPSGPLSGKLGGVRYDAESSSLLTDADTSDRLRYSVESALPRLDAGQLQSASTALPAGQSARYLDLPSGFPARVRALAASVTRGGPAVCAALTCSATETSSGQLTPFHQARALQDWFRANFTYDLNVPAGHDESAIERFLFATRRGYCEQFAGSFAAMARSVGLPSRVAVGFTSGTQQDDGRWHVTDREAHAWPEVYLAPFGWVAFEPTPGRALPGAEAYTGLSGPSGATGAATGPGPSATPTTTAAAPDAGPDTTEATAPPASAGTRRGGSRWPSPSPIIVVVALALLYAGALPLVSRARRSRRRARATSPDSRVLLAWTEVTEDLAFAGLRRRAAETVPEYAARAAAATGGGSAMADLATYVTAATFSPTGTDDLAARSAESAATSVRSELAKDVTPLRRAVRSLDPRALVPTRA